MNITQADIDTGNQIARSLMGCCGNGEFCGFEICAVPSVMQAKVQVGSYTDYVGIAQDEINSDRIEQRLKALWLRYQDQ